MTKSLLIFFNPIILLLKQNLTLSLQNSSKDMFSYRSQLRTMLIKTSGVNGCVDKHHVIPQQYKDHAVFIKLNYQIHSSYNIAIVANANFKKHSLFYKFPGILIHEGGHLKYNKYVKDNLDEINYFSEEEMKFRFWLFHSHLKDSIDNNCKNIPWN